RVAELTSQLAFSKSRSRHVFAANSKVASQLENEKRRAENAIRKAEEEKGKVEDLEKNEISSQLDQARARDEKAAAVNVDQLAQLEKANERAENAIRIAQEVQADSAEAQLDSKRGVKESLEKKDEKVEELEERVADLSILLETAKRMEAKAMRIAGQNELNTEHALNQLDSKRGIKESLEKKDEKVEELE
ncbi:hypothetical protein PENTCL1PPCAC_13134, partial [Pristionchus entomophagus]